MIKTFDTAYTIKSLLLNDGCNITYIDEGAGPQTLLLVHGLATYALSWRKNIDYLKKYYRCIAIDLPGNGFSDRGDFPYSIRYFADAVHQVIDKLKLKNVCLIGHSMGGQIVLTAIINHPDCADSMVLCAPAGFETFTVLERSIFQSSLNLFDFFSTDENSLRKTIKSSFYHNPAQADEMINELLTIMNIYPQAIYRRMIEKCMLGMLNEPVYDSLHQIKQKTFVMFGERDALIPNKLVHPVTTKKIAEDGIKQMPDATLKMIPQCGHFLQWEKADVVNVLVKEFLETIS